MQVICVQSPISSVPVFPPSASPLLPRSKDLDQRFKDQYQRSKDQIQRSKFNNRRAKVHRLKINDPRTQKDHITGSNSKI